MVQRQTIHMYFISFRPCLNYSYYIAYFVYGFAGELEYVKINGSAKRSRKRNIVWFNSPYSDHVKTNIGKEFLKLVAIHFSQHHRLHKICNKNNIKLSYSCMPNMAAIISKHSKIVLQNRADPRRTTPSCNCKNKANCPLEGKCRESSIIYKLH